MRPNERGNVFFYILTAVFLLAALSYAVSQGGRTSSSQLTQDTQNLVASEIIGYGDTISNTITQLRLRGTQITELSFANQFLSSGEYGTYNNDPANEVFNPAGGAIVYQTPPDRATTTVVDYEFLANNEVHNIGRTCGAANCSDLIMALPSVRESICIKINDLLGVTNPAGVPPTDADIRETEKFLPGATPFGYSETISDEDTALEGKSEACFQETSDTEYVYYKVLLPQ